MLFIPTASSDSELYYKTVKKYFGTSLGCQTDVLYIINDNPNQNKIEEKVFGSDIVYVGGGKTLKMMKKTSGTAIVIDNCCAIEVVDNKYRIISSKPSANAYKVYWKSNKFYEEVIEKEKEFRPLKELLKKFK